MPNNRISPNDQALQMQLVSYSRCFPRLLHFVLSVVDRLELSHIISWSPDGTHFTISNTDDFMRHVAPRFFPSQSNYKSFYRQLNLWGFERVGKLRQKGCGWRHPSFVRDIPTLAAKLKRQPFKTENVIVKKWQSEPKSCAGGKQPKITTEKKQKMSGENNVMNQFAPSSEVVDAVHGLIALKHCCPHHIDYASAAKTA
mmetsp:Transcript_24017/g.50652  ORF Transcript_24017/g.50652 Transcript_24017/m.50652 type:complete len:199 (+) Transcript_24017:253-849(+)|eukprot:CAMPEP_0171348888 /NCGR_PEP_ID=MMETSP0878-20121228/32152_1 /TAXON_ID=67004 /ORGANISM="Thalassiosira weissflogii, Strain CCMP1336" /LENGTH=198 /DNA_ID=CAMNT_0011853363 /DNA_START=207 /DNA_END=803 /DNA_ORIENTATION=-